MIKDEIRKTVNSCGIRDIGFCGFDALCGRLLDCRAKARLPENSRTVIVCVFPYKVKKEPPRNISRYAAVPDYHRVCGSYLERACSALRTQFPENRFQWFTDNSPIPEVYAAAIAGLGSVGDNGMLITPRYGSYVFIGEIVTDIYVKTQNHYRECMHCGRCKSACPTELDKTRCLSALSQKKGDLDPEAAAVLKEHNIIWGCDICAESCPLNMKAQNTYIKEFISGYRDSYTAGEDITGRAYEWRGEKTVKRNYSGSLN